MSNYAYKKNPMNITIKITSTNKSVISNSNVRRKKEFVLSAKFLSCQNRSCILRFVFYRVLKSSVNSNYFVPYEKSSCIMIITINRNLHLSTVDRSNGLKNKIIRAYSNNSASNILMNEDCKWLLLLLLSFVEIMPQWY